MQDDLLSIGEDSGALTLHELKDNPESNTVENDELISIEAHKSRVKCINLFKKVPGLENSVICFVTAGSDGVITLWKLQVKNISGKR